MNASNQALLAQLLTLLDALSRRDEQGRVARESAQKLKAAAKRGDKAAQSAWNTLSALYWGRMPGGGGGGTKTSRPSRPPATPAVSSVSSWQKAEAAYAKLLADEPGAVSWFRTVRERARLAGPASDEAKKTLATLKSVHNHRKASVWYPGAPVSPAIGYSMPLRHRPGIVIGGPFDNLGSQLPGLLGQVPGLGNIPGLPSLDQAPDLLGQVPGLDQLPGLGGGSFPGQSLLSKFLPLTTSAATSLLAMIAQARQAPGSPPRMVAGILTTTQMTSMAKGPSAARLAAYSSFK
jgi:hypothetical protein